MSRARPTTRLAVPSLAVRCGRLVAVLLGLLLLLGTAVPATAASAGLPTMLPGASESNGDRILSRDIAYDVGADGTATVSDTIQYRFGPGGGERNGIFVDYQIRADYAPSPDHYRLYPFELRSVESPTGAPTQVEQQEEGPLVRLQIGDADRTVSGTQTYVITYAVAGLVNGLQDREEIYLNPFSTEGGVPVDRATVRLTAPQPATGIECYVGERGSRQRCAGQAGATSTFTATGLAANQGMSVVAAYPLGTFTDTEPILRTGSASSGGGVGEDMPVPLAQGLTATGYGVGTLAPLAALVLMGLLVRRKGRDERYAGLTPGVMPADGDDDGAGGKDTDTVRRGSAGPVAVRFEPPDGAAPGLVGTIIDERADTLDVSATVIDLAVRGHLTIEEISSERVSKADWKLVRNRGASTEGLRRYERTVLEGVFADSDETTLGALKNRFATTLDLTKKQLYREVVDLGWFHRSPEATRQFWATVAVIVLAVGAVLLAVGGVASPSIDARAGWGFGLPSGVVLGGGLLLAGLVVFLLGRRMPAKTAKGSAINAQAVGFRQYLETAEANQIRFEEAQAIFSRYLPYAIVFGCAERWAAVFNEVAEAAHAQGYDLVMPAWYVFYGAPLFVSFDGIASGMDDFSTVAAGTMTSTPGSSGESGFSAGGGFAGGGGFGGGSVGSW